MMVLADTSVWVDHFRRTDSGLQRLLRNGDVVIHPAVIGELACGAISRREEVLSDLHRLPAAVVASTEETLFVIETHRLWGKGIGWIDAQLIASALISSGCELWTRDKRLDAVARALGIGWKR